MSKKMIASCFVISFIFVSSMTEVYATLWEDIEPQEVVNKADVIVEGEYDFTSESIFSEKTVPFCGLEFDVEKIYKGNISDRITAGMDCYDSSLIENFQRDGGQFLLFLEYNGKVGFLTPVGGPNGMVKLKNGEIQDENEERREFFEEFLEEKNKPNDSSLLFYIIASAILGLAVIVLAYYAVKKKRKK